MIESVLIRGTNENINQVHQQVRETKNPVPASVFGTCFQTMLYNRSGGGVIEHVKNNLRLPDVFKFDKN